MATTKNINYNLYTLLPATTVMKADNANPVIEVLTPHRGVVFIEIKTVDRGMFRPATEIDRNTNDVIAQLRNLEHEAKNYLLSEWLNRSNGNEV